MIAEMRAKVSLIMTSVSISVTSETINFLLSNLLTVSTLLLGFSIAATLGTFESGTFFEADNRLAKIRLQNGHSNPTLNHILPSHAYFVNGVNATIRFAAAVAIGFIVGVFKPILMVSGATCFANLGLAVICSAVLMGYILTFMGVLRFLEQMHLATELIYPLYPVTLSQYEESSLSGPEWELILQYLWSGAQLRQLSDLSPTELAEFEDMAKSNYDDTAKLGPLVDLSMLRIRGQAHLLIILIFISIATTALLVTFAHLFFGASSAPETEPLSDAVLELFIEAEQDKGMASKLQHYRQLFRDQGIDGSVLEIMEKDDFLHLVHYGLLHGHALKLWHINCKRGRLDEQADVIVHSSLGNERLKSSL